MIIDELRKPRISIDLFSGREQYVGHRHVQPMPEHIIAALEGCLMAIKCLGEVGKMIEAVKISFFQRSGTDYLELNLTTYLIEPWPSAEKIEVKTGKNSHNLRHTPHAFNSIDVARSIQIDIADAISSRAHLYDERKRMLDGYLSKELAPHL